MAKKGKVIVLVAPSGAGKTTIAKRLLSDFKIIRFSVSATTREPRVGELDGRDYHFLTPDTFQDCINKDEFIEWEEFYGGKRYGTLKSEVDKQLNLGYFVLLDIEVNGALNVKRIYDNECLSIFVKPPSIDILKERLLARKTEDSSSLELRLERAAREIEYADRFDQVVVNDELETAYQEVKSLVSEFIHT